MVNRVSETLKKLFPNDFEELVPVKEPWYKRMDFSSLKGGWELWLIGFMLIFTVISSAYFYNRFVTLETQVLTDRAQIGAQLQRRKDLLINLSKTVIDYARHERRMFRYMADKRAASIENTDGMKLMSGEINLAEVSKLPVEKLSGMMSSLMALAENYPELKLSNNFQKLMDALVDIETRIVEFRMAYNSSCNKYGTYIKKFPQNMYAFSFGFKMHPFIEADEDVSTFSRFQYSEDETPGMAEKE